MKNKIFGLIPLSFIHWKMKICFCCSSPATLYLSAISFLIKPYRRRNDARHSNIHNNDIQHNDIQHNYIQHNDIKYNDKQYVEMILKYVDQSTF
jgi:hypothetical protein